MHRARTSSRRHITPLLATTLLASGITGATATQAQAANYPPVTLVRNIYLKAPPPAGSPTVGLPTEGPRRIFLEDGPYQWSVRIRDVNTHWDKLTLTQAGNYNWRCYLTPTPGSNVYKGNCVLDYLGDGEGGPYIYLPRNGSSMTWTINSDYTYEWSTTLTPQFGP